MGAVIDQFQSLSGFLMSCNAITGTYHYLLNDEFQSLSGFLMSCNTVFTAPSPAPMSVSIPIGFSNEL